MTLPATYEEDLFSDAVIQNPWPSYARMRDLGPVIWLPGLGNYALARHREVQAALRDHDTFISADGVAADKFGCDFLQGNTVASDGARHNSLRRAMAQPMLPGALAAIRPRVQQQADQLIDALVARDSFDAVADLARHLPLSIVREMVGLPEFGQDKMLQWAAAAFDVLGVQNCRGKRALPVIAQMREFITRDATRENLKDGSWTHRIHELVDQGQLSPELAPFAIRDYINPSLDTTISATAELIYQLARNPDQWEKLKQHPELLNNAVNEAVRLGTPIRMFSRHTSRDVDIAGVTIPGGSRVMMLFASANRDERRFADPDKFDVSRDAKDHVGFGSGVHMCVGMHLAQLEMEAILHAMITRVGSIVTEAPQVKLNNTICAFSALPCRFEAESRQWQVPSLTTMGGKQLLQACVTQRREVAKGIVCFDLVPATGVDFPEPSAGAHIDVWMPAALVRQYSLTLDYSPGKYSIAVQLAANSRGGSRWMHDSLTVGSIVSISAPKNYFRLQPFSGLTVLVAGGIGLTPLLAMAWQLHHRARPFELHVCVRSADRMPFSEECKDWPFADCLHLYCDDGDPLAATFDMQALIKNKGSNLQLYVCGPGGFMEMVTSEAKAAGLDEANLHLEHFGAEIDPNGEPFTLVARKTGRTMQVPVNKTPLQVLQAAGIPVPTSCQQGVCGSCLTTVLDGIPEHRDMVQTDLEKSYNNRIAVCCSRSLSKTLVLDI